MSKSKLLLPPAAMKEVHKQRKLIGAVKLKLTEAELTAQAAILEALGIKDTEAYAQVRGVDSKNPELLIIVDAEVTAYSITGTQAEILVEIGFGHGS